MAALTLVFAYKVGACVALALAVFAAAMSAVGDPEGPVRREVGRYVEFLNGKLRSMFLRPSGGAIALGQVAIVALLGVVTLLFDIPYWYALIAVAAVGPALVLERRRRSRIAEIERQLDPFILALSNALRSIPSVSAAFQSVIETSPPPIRDEIQLCAREMRVGTTLDEALLHMAERVGSTRLDSVLSAIVLGRRIGGDLPRVLENIAASIRELYRLEAVLRAKTAEAKMQLYVIGAAPFVLMVVLSLVSPGYFDPLQQSATGYLVGFAAAGAWLMALFLARKVLSVAI
jgi:tight adherence protein B